MDVYTSAPYTKIHLYIFTHTRTHMDTLGSVPLSFSFYAFLSLLLI